MQVSQQQLIEMVKGLPDPIDTEEVIHRIFLMEKLALAEGDIAAGRTLSNEEVKARVATWAR